MSVPSLPLPPIALLELATGYQRSKTLFALIEFALPGLLAQRPLSIEDVARALRVHAVAADRFVNACVALGLLERDGEVVRNTPLSQQFLVQGHRLYLGDQLLKYARASYPLWMNLTRRLQEWRPGLGETEPLREADQGPTAVAAHHNLSLLVGNALGRAYDFSRHRRMLDLGGGTGAMAIGVCSLHEQLRATVVELPQIAEAARTFINDGALSGRIEVAEGNFKEDALPAGFDVALLANLLSVSSEATNRELLRRIYRRLPDGGAVILSGWILDDSRTSPLLPVLFCLEDINWHAPDVERSAATYEKWLAEAGFVEIQREVYCPPTSMIVGRKRRVPRGGGRVPRRG